MRKLFIIISLFISTSVSSQQTYSLEELIQITLIENYQIQIISIQQLISQNQNSLGNAGMLPTVGVSAESSWDILNSESKFFSGDIRKGENANSNKLNAMVQFNWTVFDGFAMFAQRDRLSAIEQISKSDYKFYLEQTIADISNIFYALIKEINLYENHKETIKISEFRLKIETEKVKIGAGNKLTYNQAFIDFQSDSIVLIKIEQNIKDLQIQINQIINKELISEFTPNTNKIDLKGIEDLKTLISKALQNNPEIEKAKLEEVLAETNRKIAMSERYPEVNLFGNYSYNKSQSEIGFIESSQNFGPAFGLNVRFNLYDGGKTNMNIKNLDLVNKNAELEQKDAEKLINTEITRIYYKYNSYLIQYQKIKEIINTLAQTIEISKQQYQTGAISSFEFRQVQLTAINARNQMVELEYLMKIIELDIHRICGN
jgi:outer membrane protein